MSDIIKGQNVMLYEATTDPVLYGYPFAFGRTCDINYDTNLIETTTANSGSAREYLPQYTTATINFEGIASITTGTSRTVANILTKVTNRTLIQVKFVSTNIDGTALIISCAGYITSCKHAGNRNDVATYNFTIQVSGALVIS